MIRREIADELHDGILQVLTGASLEIEAIVRLAARDPDEALRRLRSVADAIANEQRELRLFIEEFRLEEEELDDGGQPFHVRLREMLRRVEHVWPVKATLESEVLELDTGPARSVLRIVQEAVVNAVRHGAATRVTVSLHREPERLVLTVADDGIGFSFRGTLELAELRIRRLGPISLKRRVAAAGGDLRIDSSPEGATLRVSVPLPASTP